MDHTIGVLIAIASSFLGGSAAAVTRYLVGNADPLTLAILRLAWRGHHDRRGAVHGFL
jgi:drug/metabolite transporter (DMT)-like permease